MAVEFDVEAQLTSVLGRLLRQSRRLVGAMAGSVSLVDPGGDRYAKLAEYGASCQVGRSFPLGEGVTGMVMSRRRPVVLDCYGDVRSGHLPSEHPASRGSVAAVPIWWLGEVIGANVVFAGRAHRFGSHQVDELEMLAQVAAPGIVRAGWSRPLTARWGAAHPGSAGCPLTPRERQVLGLVGRGMSDREVAAALVISPKTAEKHVAAALRKTGAARRTGAVLRALDRGWLSADLVGDD